MPALSGEAVCNITSGEIEDVRPVWQSADFQRTAMSWYQDNKKANHPQILESQCLSGISSTPHALRSHPEGRGIGSSLYQRLAPVIRDAAPVSACGQLSECPQLVNVLTCFPRALTGLPILGLASSGTHIAFTEPRSTPASQTVIDAWRQLFYEKA